MAALRKSLRFEILKRDGFTCQYCGGTPPGALLEVDHVHPRAEGGSDDPENLITACDRCNRGKGARLLNDRRAPHLTPQAVADAKERAEQARAYHAWLREQRASTDDLLAEVMHFWWESFGGHRDGDDLVCDVPFPNERSVRVFLKRLPAQDILEAIEIAASTVQSADSSRSAMFFYKVCWNKIRALEAVDG